jgi:transcriptional regulator with XRE-family HTH domain
MSDANAFSDAIGRRRTARGWSQSELARRARVPRTTVSAIEGGEAHPLRDYGFSTGAHPGLFGGRKYI